MDLGRWCRCRVPLPDAWPCALWSLGAVAAARCVATRAFRLGAVWDAGAIGGRCRVSLQGAAARCLWQCAASSCTLMPLPANIFYDLRAYAGVMFSPFHYEGHPDIESLHSSTRASQRS